METKQTDTVAHWMAAAQDERAARFAAQEREQCAIASWDEERKRALREAGRVLEANKLLEEAFSHVRNIPLADDISKHLAQFNPQPTTHNSP